MDDLRISDTVVIPAGELKWTFSPTGGPGGQHANRSSTRAELRFDAAASRVLNDETKQRILDRLRGRRTITVIVDETRSQWRNRQIARARLADRIRDAIRPDPPARRTTKPSRAARRRRLDDKRHRSRTKAWRRSPQPED